MGGNLGEPLGEPWGTLGEFSQGFLKGWGHPGTPLGEPWGTLSQFPQDFLRDAGDTRGHPRGNPGSRYK